MVIEINEPYIEQLSKQIGIDNLKKEIINFLNNKFKPNIDEEIKNSPIIKTNEAKKFLQICNKISHKLQNQDIESLKDDYFKQKGYL